MRMKSFRKNLWMKEQRKVQNGNREIEARSKVKGGQRSPAPGPEGRERIHEAYESSWERAMKGVVNSARWKSFVTFSGYFQQQREAWVKPQWSKKHPRAAFSFKSFVIQVIGAGNGQLYQPLWGWDSKSNLFQTGQGYIGIFRLA